MRRARACLFVVPWPWLAAASLAAAAFAGAACAPDAPADDTVCAQASHVFAKCGASLPLLESGSCTGLRKAVATCVASHATTCDELGSLGGRLDACVNDTLDGGDSFLPPDELPSPATKHDAGKGDASIPPPPPAPAPAPTGDASTTTPPLVDAGADGATTGSGSVLDVSGAVALAEEKRFVTAPLAAGSYTFDMTGTGDADLYVKVGSAPRTNSWDCRPYVFGSSVESCTVSIASTETIYVMVRGEASGTSTFAVKGHP